MTQAARSLTLLGGLLLAGLLTLPARAAAAEANTKAPQPYVVLVGIGTYTDKQILPRPTAEADAKALYDLFVDKGRLGVDAKHVRLLLGTPDEKRASEPATRENILKAIAWAGKEARKDDLVIVGLFLQGGPRGERVCLFATDSTFKGRDKNAVDSGEIVHALDKLKSRKFCAFLDVNFKGFDSGTEKTTDPNIADFYREMLGGKDEEKEPAASRVLFLSSTGLKPSLTADGHGAFTKVILDGLRGKADTEGYEGDGLISVEELAKYVRKELPNLNRKIGKTDDEKGQMPAILEGQSQDFVLVRDPVVTAKTQERLVSFEKSAQTNKFPKSMVEEGEHLLRRMPKLEAQQELRKAYQRLADGKLTADQFREKRETILAGMKLPDRDAAYYARTVLRATQIVKKQFFKDVTQGQMVDLAIKELYKHLNENVPSELKDRLANVKSLKEVDLLKLLEDARRHLGKREDLDSGKDVTFSLHPMLGKLDRHTDYIDPETLTRFKIDTSGNFIGVGVQIRKNNTKDALQVVTPIKGSPAYNAGIYAGDLITQIIREVDSKGKRLDPPEVISTKGMTTEDAVKKILGKGGTKVKLVVEREGAEKPLQFELLRGSVEVESVLGTKRKTDDSWDYVIDPENKICYVRLTQFSDNTYRDLKRVLNDLAKKGGIKGFILDLRFNPGGLLDSAVKISNLFVEDGVIVTVRPREGAEVSYMARGDGTFLAFPMVCLVNGWSASGSEIVSACLQDHGRAVIMGSRSYGKGSVQTILRFDTAGGEARLKVTTATFWRPTRRNLNKSSTAGREEDEWGVTPDAGFTVKLPPKELSDLQDQLRDQEIIHRPDRRTTEGPKASTFRDRQLEMALDYIRAQLRLTAQVPASKKAS
jgi:C-terminal peptidase prc